ncbi:MAG: hypothetical protein JWP03_2353 [Phycisphaerales bacterium]|jgi:hypothetical protein|nr:hypothetical protein [Phycisphaerales bacterium]
MKVRLQQFGIEKSTYERPNQKWVCGWASSGAPCHHGPDSGGDCPGGCECRPILSGSRWLCTRSVAGGGPCDSGPLPDGACCRPIQTCRPVRSLRARRGALVVWTCALTLGLLLWALGSNWQRFASPGPLSFAHGPILAGRGTGSGSDGAALHPAANSQGCGACHVAGRTGPLGWASAATASRGHDESGLCLDCHRTDSKFRDRPSAMHAHGLPTTTLATVSQRMSKASEPTAEFTFPAMASTTPTGHDGKIDCAACHHEHRGASASLASMDNTTCQACHTTRFSSLKDGHPAFRNYPSAATGAVAFDHARHRDQHFPKTESFQCGSCHTPSPNGRMLQPPTFDLACARCHSEHFNGKAEPSRSGIVLLQIPALDLKTLGERKVDVGQWPHYDGDPPVRLAPFLRLLLSGGKPPYLDALPPDLGQLQNATEPQIRAVQDLAWAIKRLVGERAGPNEATGLPSVQARISAALGRELTRDQFADLTGGLAPDDMKEAARRWFPELSKELAAGPKLWEGSPAPPHEAPAAPAAPPTTKSAAPASDDLFNDDKPAAPTPAPAPSATKPSAAADDDLFNGDTPAATKPAPPTKAPVASAPPTTRPVAEASDDLFNGGPADPAAPAAATRPSEALPLATAPAPAAAKPIITLAGWERDDDRFALIYHPRGHANTFLRAWIDMNSDHAGSTVAAAPWQAQVAGPDGGAACTKCHVSRQPAGVSGALVWRSLPADSMGRGFVKFSHRPHLLESRLQDCSACHTLPDPTAASVPTLGAAGFLPISKESCAACHAPRLASDSCLTCHNYHVAPRTTAATAGLDPTSR